MQLPPWVPPKLLDPLVWKLHGQNSTHQGLNFRGKPLLPQGQAPAGNQSQSNSQRAMQREAERNQRRQDRVPLYNTDSTGRVVPGGAVIATANEWATMADANGWNPEGGDGGGGGGGGGSYLPPVSLPRLGMPSDMELAKLAYSAVDASRMPFNAQRANLQAARTRGMNDIAAAQRDARTGTVQAWDTWRNATSGLEDRVGSAYQSAAAQLAANMNAANASLLARGFRPQAANPEMLAAMGALGANAQSYASTRRMQGEDARANALSGVSQIDQAARGTMASTYSSVLGQIAASAAAAEAQARLDVENRIFDLRRQVEQANNQTAIQEALANSGR